MLLVFGCGPGTIDKTSSNLPENEMIGDATARMPDSVLVYLQSALDTMRHNSIRTKDISWLDLKLKTFALAQGAQTYPQTYPAIREAITILGDNHSFFKTPLQQNQWTQLKRANNDNGETKYAKGRMTSEKFAVIPISTFSSGNPNEMLRYALELQKSIRLLDTQNPVAWIIDLRYNRGGNMWPMLAGIGPLLETQGSLGSFITADNHKVEWKYANGTAFLENASQVEVPNPYKVRNRDLPVAILTSSNTASSGEAILISFLGRPKTRVFGEPTAGLSTANSDHALKDGAQLILTSAIFADRTGKKYSSKIIPHEDLSKRWYYLTGFEFVTAKCFVNDWVASMNN